MDNNVLDLQLDSDKGVVYSHTVTPGEVIVNSSAYMRYDCHIYLVGKRGLIFILNLSGHGVIQEDSSLIAAVAGQVVRVNKLICVVPYQRRYALISSTFHGYNINMHYE